MSKPAREPPSYDMIAVTKYSIAENLSVPSLGVNPRLPWYKTNALTTEPKSRLSDAAEAMQNLPYVDIKLGLESAWPIS